jgi:hypothetical protein
MSHVQQNKSQEVKAANNTIVDIKHNTGTAPELTLNVVYKSRHTRQLVTIVNPSKAHLQRLAMTGHDLLIRYFTSGKLVKEEKRLY